MAHRHLSIYLLSAFCALLAACGGGSSGGGGGSSSSSGGSSSSSGGSGSTCSPSCTVSGASGASATVNSSGGTISYYPSGVTSGTAPVVLSVPAGAVAQATTLTLTPMTSGFPTDADSVGTVYQLGPAGTVFNQPVTLTLTYDPNTLGSVEEGTLTIYQLVNGVWTGYQGTLDTDNHTVTVLLSGFSAGSTDEVQSLATARLRQALGLSPQAAPPTFTVFSLGGGTVAGVTPGTGSTIGGTTTLNLTSNRTITAVTVTGGTLFPAGSPPTTTLSGALTATLTPATTWVNGSGKTLIFRVAANGRTSAAQTETYTVDGTLPGDTSITPASGATLLAATPIRVQFSKSMDPASLVLAGVLAGENPTAAFSTTTLVSDTLILTPPPAGWTDSGGVAQSLTVSIRDSVGNILTPNPLTLNYVVDATAPTGSANPASGIINASTPLVFTFSKTMNPASLTLMGNLATPTPGEVWSTTVAANDTLTLTPALGGWGAITGSAPGTLAVSAQDLAGNPLAAPLILTFTVDAQTPTVSVLPVSGTIISGRQALSYAFSQSMNPATLLLSGNLSVLPPTATWSQSRVPNDTLLVTPPAAGWTNSIGGPANTLTLSVNDAGGNPLVSAFSVSYPVDTSLTAAPALPVSGSTINGRNPLVLSFSGSVNPATLALSGTMATPTPGITWSTNLVANDTLTLAPPLGGWADSSAGPPSTMNVSVNDLVGNPASDALSYTVDATLPTGTAAPQSGSVLGGQAALVVTFSQSMTPTSIALGGTLASQAVAPVWSAGTAGVNSVLTLNPVSSGWTSTLGGPMATLKVTASDSDGNAMGSPVSLSYAVDSNQPTAGVFPSSTSVISGQQAIVVTFNDTMDSTTLALGGSMSSPAPNPTWSTTVFANDTVTLRPPAGGWANTEGGPNGSLTVSASNLGGVAIAAPLSLGYTVDAVTPQAQSVTPASGSTIPGATSLVMVFNEWMNPAGLQLSGTMAVEAAAPVWSTTHQPNDTLTISPAGGSWPTTLGLNDTLTVLVTDRAGNPLATPINLQFVVGVPQPTLKIGNLLNNGVTHSGFVIGTAADSAGVTLVTVSIDGGTPANATLVSPNALSTGWSFKLPFGLSTWREGTQHSLTIQSFNEHRAGSAIATIQVRKGVNQDVNGDGYADVAVGANTVNSSAGAVYVFHSQGTTGLNPTAAASTIASTAANTTLTGPASSQFGSAVVLGDVNGDGYADVVVGASDANSNAGAAYVFHSQGATGLNPTSAASTIASTAANTALTGPASSQFGSAVAIGDVNGDGYEDVVVGALALNSNSGGAYVFHSQGATGLNPSNVASTIASTSANTALTGPAGSDFGHSLALGDVNGDNYADVVVGAHLASSDAGAAYVFHSHGTTGLNATAAASTNSFSAANTTLTGAAGGEFGWAVALGDVNGDGCQDLAVSTIIGLHTGALVYVFHSQGSTGLNATVAASTIGFSAANTTLAGSGTSVSFGYSLNWADVNGDGYADLIVGLQQSDNADPFAYVFQSQGTTGLNATAAPSTIAASAATANTTFNGTFNNLFEESLALEDVNGDGYPDLVHGTPTSAFVFHSQGATGFNATVAASTIGTSAANTTLTGPASSGFGISVALDSVALPGGMAGWVAVAEGKTVWRRRRKGRRGRQADEEGPARDSEARGTLLQRWRPLRLDFRLRPAGNLTQ